MKHAAIIMVLLLVLAVAGVGFLYMTANVTVEALGVTATEAVSQPDYFSAFSRQLEDGAVSGTVFRPGRLGAAENYQFLTYTVRLNNRCFLPADMIEVQITPMEGDVAQLGAASSCMLDARAVGDVQATILTDIRMHAIREITITYYMWGLPFTIRTAYNIR